MTEGVVVDHHPNETQFSNTAIKFADRCRNILKGERGKAGKTGRMAADHVRQDVVGAPSIIHGNGGVGLHRNARGRQ